jgi:hypothetical protein
MTNLTKSDATLVAITKASNNSPTDVTENAGTTMVNIAKD